MKTPSLISLATLALTLVGIYGQTNTHTPVPASQRFGRPARIYHVSPNGNDAGKGTAETPFKTIQKAADSVRPGDTVQIQGGIYQEFVTLRRSGQYMGRIIRFQGATNEPVINKGDFHLRASSPAMDRGYVHGFISTDQDGKPRLQGKGIDIGAFETVP